MHPRRVFATLITILATAGAWAEPPAAPDLVVVTYREIHGEIGETDRAPAVQVFGDGRIRVHYPRYMKRAGDYTAQLDAAELDRLLASLTAKGIATFDADGARRTREAARARRDAVVGQAAEPTIAVVVDAPITLIELDVGGGPRTVSWQGLQDDAERYPDVAAIANLAQAEKELRRLMRRRDLRRSDGGRS